MGHIERDCLRVPEEDRTEEKMWASWLRASPRRGRIKMLEEAKQFRSCARTLSFSPSSVPVEEVAAINPLNFNLEVTSPVQGEETSVHEPVCMHEEVNAHHDHAIPLSGSPPLNGSVSIPAPLLFASGSVSPKEGRKLRVKPRKKSKDINIPVLVENCCLNVEIIDNSGLKRKHSDDMIIDDSVDMTLGQKKTKLNDGSIVGSNLMTVEAEVGEIQPRQAL